MPIFISYSHEDEEFVDHLAAHLIKARAHVWVDRWELRVGDSILTRVQEAIGTASALLVILSKASVVSEWCKRELNAGLVRELEEKRVVVLPVLIEDCEIPLFLRDKLYADFRTNFDEGIAKILESVASVTSDTQGRVISPEFHVDWAMDWFYVDDRFHLRFTLVEQALTEPFSILTEILIMANKTATERYRQYEAAGLDWVGRQVMLEALGWGEKDLFFILDDQFPQAKELQAVDPKTNIGFEVMITSRRLGNDTGKSILLNLTARLETIRDSQRQTLRQLTRNEMAQLLKIVGTPPHI
jgi:hypothetical protein